MRNIGLVIAITLTATASWLSAASITVNNPSFEADGEHASAVPTGWSCDGTPTYVGASDLSTLVGPYDGTYTGYVSGYPTANPDPLYQNVGASFVQGMTYELKVLVGRRTDSTDLVWYGSEFPWAIRLDYADGSGAAASTSGALNLADCGNMYEQTLTYAATASDAGKGIRISLVNSHDYTAGKYSQVQFDNVRLSVTPEPTSMAVLLIGGALVGVRKRRA